MSAGLPKEPDARKIVGLFAVGIGPSRLLSQGSNRCDLSLLVLKSVALVNQCSLPLVPGNAKHLCEQSRDCNNYPDTDKPIDHYFYMIHVSLLVVGVNEDSCPTFVKKGIKKSIRLTTTLESFCSASGISSGADGK